MQSWLHKPGSLVRHNTLTKIFNLLFLDDGRCTWISTSLFLQKEFNLCFTFIHKKIYVTGSRKTYLLGTLIGLV